MTKISAPCLVLPHVCINLILLQTKKKAGAACPGLYTAIRTAHVQFLYLLSLIAQAVFSMCSHSGQQAEETLQGVAVTGRKQEYQELDGALLV